MKHLLELGDGTSKRQPHINRSFEWIQEAYTESIEAILEAIIPDTDGIYVKLYGLELTSNGVNTSVSAGAIYYNGEVYQVPAFSLNTTTIYNDVFFKESASFDAVDPITFTDGTTASVHQNKIMVVLLEEESPSDPALSELFDLRKHLEMVDSGVDTFIVFNGDTSAWVTSARNLVSGSFIKAHKVGKKITLAFKLICNFNNTTANNIDFACTRIGFNLPTWLQPLEGGIMERVVKYRNDASGTLNVVENAFVRMWKDDPTSNAPDVQIFTHGFNLNGGATKGLVTGISGRPLNYQYPSDATGSQIATSTSFQVQVHGEITYEAANLLLG